MKALMRFIYIIIALVVLVIGAAAIFILTFDLNSLKPALKDAVAEHQGQLDIPGELSWKFWPNLGLHLGEMTLTDSSSGQLLASINSASVSIKVKPLLSKQLEIDGLYLDGMTAAYTVDAQGKSQWQPMLDSLSKPAPEQEKAADTESATPSESSPPELLIDRIAITNLSLDYQNQQDGTRASVSGANLSCSGFATDGTPFPLEMDANLTYNQMRDIHVTWHGPLAVDLANSTLAIDQAEAGIGVDNSKATVRVTTKTQWAPQLTSDGSLNLQTAQLKALLKGLGIEIITKDPDVLASTELDLDYALTPEAFTLKSARIQMDETEIQGRLAINNLTGTPAIRSEWKGTQIDFERYLPPASETNEEAPNQELPPQPLPLDSLRALDLETDLQFEQIRKGELALNRPQLSVMAKDGLLKISQLTGELAQGYINGQGVLDARGNEAQLTFNMDSQGVNLGQLLKAVADVDKVEGSVSADVQLTSHGATDKALTDNLTAQAEAQSEGLKIIPVNLEEQFCNAIAILQREKPQAYDWPEQTQLEPVRMQLKFAEQKLQLETLSAQLANLVGAATGYFKVDTGKFNVPFSLSLGDFAESLPGCLPIEEKWRKRALPIRCKGSMDDIGVGTCLPDTKLLEDMLKEKVKAKVEAEKDRAEEKLKNKAKDLLQKELGDEKSKQTEETVRGILDQIKGR